MWMSVQNPMTPVRNRMTRLVSFKAQQPPCVRFDATYAKVVYAFMERSRIG